MTITRYFKNLFPKEVWGYNLILLLFVSRKTFFDVARTIGDYSVTGGGNTVLAMMAIGLSILVMLNNQAKIRYLWRHTKIFIIYYLFAICSMIWAYNYFTIGFKGTEVLTCFFLVGVSILSLKSKSQAMLYVIFISTAITWCDIINNDLKNGLSIVQHTNGYTITALIGLLTSSGCIKFGVFSFKQMKWYIFLCAYGLIFGTSSASYISFIIGLIVLWGFSKRRFNVGRTIFFCALALVAYKYAFSYIEPYIFYGKTEEAIKNGTGRESIWEAAWQSFKANPYLGSGFLVGERSLDDYDSRLGVVSAHSTYLSVLVNTGIVGSIIFLIFILQWLVGTFRKVLKKNFYAYVMFPVICALLVNISAMPAIGSDWNYAAPCLYALIVVCMGVI